MRYVRRRVTVVAFLAIAGLPSCGGETGPGDTLQVGGMILSHDHLEVVARGAALFHPGDTITFRVDVSSKRPLEWVGFEVQGAAPILDSVAVPDSLSESGPLSLTVHLYPSAAYPAGPIQVLAIGRDAGGRRQVVLANSPAYVYQAQPAVATTIGSRGQITDLAWDASRNHAYLALADSHRIEVLQLPGMTYAAPVPLPARPEALDLTPSDDSLVVATLMPDSIAVVDLVPAQPVVHVRALGLVSPVGSFWPTGVRVARGGHALISMQVDAIITGMLADLNLTTGTARLLTAEHQVSDRPPIARSADRSRVAFVSGSSCCDVDHGLIYEVAHDTLVVKPGFAVAPYGPFSLSADGNRMLFGKAVLGSEFEFDALMYPPAILASHITEDGTVGLHATQRGILRVRLDDGAGLDELVLGWPPIGIRPLPGGMQALIWGFDSLALVQLPAVPTPVRSVITGMVPRHSVWGRAHQSSLAALRTR